VLEDVPIKPQLAKKRQNRFFLFVAIAGSVAVAAIIAAMQFGDQSPLIAKGKVVLAPSLLEKVQDHKTLFIIVRGPEMPMPIGAARKELSTPVSTANGVVYDFVLTKEFLQMMQPDQALPPKITIKARLDVDGQGGPDMPGDLVGETRDVALGANEVQVLIDRIVEP